VIHRGHRKNSKAHCEPLFWMQNIQNQRGRSSPSQCSSYNLQVHYETPVEAGFKIDFRFLNPELFRATPKFFQRQLACRDWENNGDAASLQNSTAIARSALCSTSSQSWSRNHFKTYKEKARKWQYFLREQAEPISAWWRSLWLGWNQAGTATSGG